MQGRAIGQRSGDRVTDHPSSRREAHAAHDEGADRSDARARLRPSAALDNAQPSPRRSASAARIRRCVDLLIPIVKGWCTEQGIEIASLGVQVHGGMGFIEETGAAQYLRDARITTIYEGTTGIQANDLVGRKVGFEKGATAFAIIEVMRKIDAKLATSGNPDVSAARENLRHAIDGLAAATQWVVDTFPHNPQAVAAVSVPFLKLWGTVGGGWLMARAALSRTRKPAPTATRISIAPRS